MLTVPQSGRWMGKVLPAGKVCLCCSMTSSSVLFHPMPQLKLLCLLKQLYREVNVLMVRWAGWGAGAPSRMNLHLESGRLNH
jgi:hypothetical protein